MPDIPADVWVAIIGLGGPVLLAVGYFLRPLGDFFGEVVRDRRADRRRTAQFQFDTLVALSEALEAWRAVRNLRGRVSQSLDRDLANGQERTRVLTFRVRDDDLRAKLEQLLAASDASWNDAHGDVVRRLGKVLRDL